MNVQNFTGAVISIVVVVIIAVSVLVPIVASNQIPTEGAGSIANASSINAMLNIIPLLVIVGIIIAVVALFLGKRNA